MTEIEEVAAAIVARHADKLVGLTRGGIDAFVRDQMPESESNIVISQVSGAVFEMTRNRESSLLSRHRRQSNIDANER